MTVFADRGGPSLDVVRTVPIEPVLNVAVGVDAAGRAALYIPSRAGTRRVALARAVDEIAVLRDIVTRRRAA